MHRRAGAPSGLVRSRRMHTVLFSTTGFINSKKGSWVLGYSNTCTLVGSSYSNIQVPVPLLIMQITVRTMHSMRVTIRICIDNINSNPVLVCIYIWQQTSQHHTSNRGAMTLKPNVLPVSKSYTNLLEYWINVIGHSCIRIVFSYCKENFSYFSTNCTSRRLWPPPG